LSHRLVREVRFSVNPFSAGGSDGFNSYSSKPCGEGLCFYFGLCVELAGEVDGETGFVVNVVDIDSEVRRSFVPIFADRIRESFAKGQTLSLCGLFEILTAGWSLLKDRFGERQLRRLSLLLNPFRKITIESEDCEMVYFSEKFEFAAMHKLWNDSFSEQRNMEVFGKCANPTGHGHNYVIEVTIKAAATGGEIEIGRFEKIVADEFVSMVDHKNLNVDVCEFGQMNPTVENIVSFAWKRLLGKFGSAELANITVWENDRTSCSYKG